MLAKPTYQILRVNLTERKMSTEVLDEGLIRKFLGGAGLAAKILWDETKADTDPLSDENVLVFGCGPVTATPVPSSSRLTIAALSPLTNIWGEAHNGGTAAAALRRTGYMAVVVTGKASEPVYIWVRDGGAKIVDANHVWGKGTLEADAILRKETDDKAAVATIGPAGEKLVRFATVMTDGPLGHCGGRCGMGAVMGSKNLKAIVASGTGKPPIYDAEKLRESISKNFPKLRRLKPGDNDIRLIRGYLWGDERASVKNFRLGGLEGFASKLGKHWEDYKDAEPHFCPHCRNGCSLTSMAGGKRLNHAECTVPMGSNCLIDNMEALDQAFEMCNNYGLDTISTGDIIAFAMELYEKGIITKKDTGGIELTWGNHNAMLQILPQIVDGEGFGKLLRLGSRRAAAEIGGIAAEYTMQVKGLEISLHDPRSWNHMALQNATGNRGADHMSGFIGLYTQSLLPGYQPHAYAFTHLEDEKVKEAYDNRFAVEGVGKTVAWSQDFTTLLDSLVVCQFVGYPTGWVLMPVEPFAGVQPEHLAEWLGYVTGWDVSTEEIMRIGERVFNLKRLHNVRRGISRKDDTLPPRLLTQKRGGIGPGRDNIPPLGKMLNEYYPYRGWSEEGIPTKEKLTQLDLV
jgi:aldehyde:ferredoxin oxidoreductase